MAEREQLEQQLARCDGLLREHAGAEDPADIGVVAEALCAKARTLAQLGRHGDALALWEEALERYAEDPPEGEELIGLEAGLGKARELAELERAQDALAAADETLTRWDGSGGEVSDGDALQRSRYVAATLIVKQRVFAGRGEGHRVLPITDELIGRYEESDDAYLTWAVARALAADVYWLLADGRLGEAIAAAERLRRKFRGAQGRALLAVGDPLYQAGCSLGMVIPAEAGLEARAVLLLTAIVSALRLLERERNLPPRRLWRRMAARRRRIDEAQRIFELLIERLRGLDEDPELAHLLAQAHIYLGVVQILGGRAGLGGRTMQAAWTMGEPTVRFFRTMADRALAGEGHGAAWEATVALFTLGVVHEGLGERAEAAAVYTECIERFGSSRWPPVWMNVAFARLSLRMVTRESSRG